MKTEKEKLRTTGQWRVPGAGSMLLGGYRSPATRLTSLGTNVLHGNYREHGTTYLKLGEWLGEQVFSVLTTHT